MASVRKYLVAGVGAVSVGLAAFGSLMIVLALREAGHLLPSSDVRNVLFYRDLPNTASRCGLLSFGIGGLCYGIALWLAARQWNRGRRATIAWIVALALVGTAFVGVGMRVEALYPGP